MIKILAIMGSTRDGRHSDLVARWIKEESLIFSSQIEIEIVDLRDFPLPFYDEEREPAEIAGDYKSDVAKKWSDKIGQSDGYIFITPEYNHGYPAVLKNALDYLYFEWNKKPAAFISYSSGGISGARSVQQLRQVVVALDMAPLRNAIHIPVISKAFDESGRPSDQIVATKADKFLKDLIWWAEALKSKKMETKN